MPLQRVSHQQDGNKTNNNREDEKHTLRGSFNSKHLCCQSTRNRQQVIAATSIRYTNRNSRRTNATQASARGSSGTASGTAASTNSAATSLHYMLGMPIKASYKID
jgi:hypothetical protein